jgi:transcriptional regulator with XRE-family HTH domain
VGRQPGRKRGGGGLVEQLKEAVTTSGLSLYRLAADSGVAASQLSRFLRGETNLSLGAAERVCRLLGLELVRKKHKPKK